MVTRVCVGGQCYAAACLIVVFAVFGAHSESNITLLNLPINLTSWRISLHEAFNRTRERSLSNRVLFALNDTLDFLKNGSIGCTPQGEECVPEVPSCCPSTVSGHYGSFDDEDLQCLPQDGVYRCILVTDSEDLAQLRLNALEYGDSAGQLESHPWANSWEFQSRSEAEREELQALEEAEWKKNFKPSGQDNLWIKMYNKIKKEAMDAWKNLQKIKKLKEVKDSLLDKKNKRLKPTVPPVERDRTVTREVATMSYPEELSEETSGDMGQAKTESEESVIKFSDELPKRDKKIDFRLDNIIKNALDLASQKSKSTKQGSRPLDIYSSANPSLVSEEELLRLGEIQGTVDKLMKEVSELKELKTKQKDLENKESGVLNVEDKVNGANIDELIKKHVHNILEEKRRLYKLRKIEEAKRMKQEGSFKT